MRVHNGTGNTLMVVCCYLIFFELYILFFLVPTFFVCLFVCGGAGGGGGGGRGGVGTNTSVYLKNSRIACSSLQLQNRVLFITFMKH